MGQTASAVISSDTGNHQAEIAPQYDAGRKETQEVYELSAEQEVYELSADCVSRHHENRMEVRAAYQLAAKSAPQRNENHMGAQEAYQLAFDSAPEHNENHMETQQAYQSSPVPALRRAKTRKVKLISGPVVSSDFAVPSAVLNAVQAKYKDDWESGSEEFTHLRYTAATCDPNDFILINGYNLRPAMYNRHTELAVTITVYNEDKRMLARSLHAAMQNVRDIVNLKETEFWNKGGPMWHKIVVCIIIDGVDSCDRGVLDLLSTIGLFRDGIMKKDIDGRETVAHIFEYTTQLSVTPNSQLIRPLDDGPSTLPPVQMLLCLKQSNYRKINSLRWFYSAFGRILNPEVVIHIDVGTQPGHKAFLHLWEAFYNDRNLGGACGQLHCELGRSWRMLLNPLVAAQNFEYKVAFQLDRAFEASTGYITILPGAFSAYRYRAILGKPLDEYCRGDPTDSRSLLHLGPNGEEGMSLLKKNMYLAEDRILCFETVNKMGTKWLMGCVKTAKAEADVPTTLVDLISQRRRWLNGTFAATVYTIYNFRRVYRSNHNLLRMGFFHIQFVYNLVNFVLAWTSLAGYLLTLFIVNDISGNPPAKAKVAGFPFGKATPIVNAIIQITYLCTVVLQFLLALGSRPRGQRRSYAVSLGIFGILQVYLVINLIYLFTRVAQVRLGNDQLNGQNYEFIDVYYSDIGKWTVIFSGIAAFGVYIAAGIIQLDMWHVFTCYAQYIFVLSAYTNILNVYAFCNFDDCSWGKKDRDAEKGTFDNQGSITSHTTARGTKEAVFELELSQDEIDQRFEEIVKRALAPCVDDLPHSSSLDNRSLEETAKAFRTRLLAAYIFSNFFICIFVLNGSFKQLWWLGDPYWHKIWFFRIWLWAHAGSFFMRFLGCCWDVGKSYLFSPFHRR